MRFLNTELPGVVIVEPDVFRESGGLSFESFNAGKCRAAGVPDSFVQDNFSRSERGTVRGLHAQRRHAQGKLIRVIEGEIFDVAVDIRRGSPNFGSWTSAVLSSENMRQCYIPPGFAHGFCVTSDFAHVEYKCTDFYDPSSEITLLWNDSQLGIDWPVTEPILSRKDSSGLLLSELIRWLPAYEEAA